MDVESTKDMKFKVSAKEINATGRLISIGSLIKILTNDEIFNIFQQNKNNALNLVDINRELDCTRFEYLDAFMQLYNTIQENNYNLGLTAEQEVRLKELYNEALRTLPINKIQYSKYLPSEIKLQLMIRDNVVYDR